MLLIDEEVVELVEHENDEAVLHVDVSCLELKYNQEYDCRDLMMEL